MSKSKSNLTQTEKTPPEYESNFPGDVGGDVKTALDFCSC